MHLDLKLIRFTAICTLSVQCLPSVEAEAKNFKKCYFALRKQNISVVSQCLNVTRMKSNFPTWWVSWVMERVGWPIARATHLHIPQDHPCARDTTSNLVS